MVVSPYNVIYYAAGDRGRLLTTQCSFALFLCLHVFSMWDFLLNLWQRKKPVNCTGWSWFIQVCFQISDRGTKLNQNITHTPLWGVRSLICPSDRSACFSGGQPQKAVAVSRSVLNAAASFCSFILKTDWQPGISSFPWAIPIYFLFLHLQTGGSCYLCRSGLSSSSSRIKKKEREKL